MNSLRFGNCRDQLQLADFEFQQRIAFDMMLLNFWSLPDFRLCVLCFYTEICMSKWVCAFFRSLFLSLYQIESIHIYFRLCVGCSFYCNSCLDWLECFEWNDFQLIATAHLLIVFNFSMFVKMKQNMRTCAVDRTPPLATMIVSHVCASVLIIIVL